MGVWEEFAAPQKLVNLPRSLAWITVEDLTQQCCSSDWTCNSVKSFSLCGPRQRLKCSSVKQSLFMSKEHLFLGKNGWFVSGKRDVFLQWWCCSPPSPGKLNFSHCVCFVIDMWSLDLQSSCWMASCLVKESVTQTFEIGMCKHYLSDLGCLCEQVF